MGRIVCKFGGSNLKDASGIGNVARIIEAYGRELVVVVSAFHGITNALEGALRAAAAGEGASLAESLSALKRSAIEGSIPDPARRGEAMAAVEERIGRFERFLLGVGYLGEVPDSARDAALSYGERLSSLVLARALAARGVEAEEVLPEEMGLRSDSEWGNASCDLAASAGPVAARLRGKRVFVVPGFYGIGPDGKPRLFGRGGSDYSAACIARCVGAESLDIWKDVEGFLSADPRAVPGARRIAHLHYSEAAELSYFGAKILHPRTVEPLLEPGIPIRVMNVDAREDLFVPGTVIDSSRSVSAGAVKSVSSADGIGILRLHGPGVGFKRGVLGKAASVLDARGVNIKSAVTAQTAICLLLAEGDLGAALDALSAHRVEGVAELSAEEGLSLVAVVGDGMLEPGRGIASRALGAAMAAGVHVALAQAGASEFAVYLAVGSADRDRAIRAMHREFFPGGGA